MRESASEPHYQENFIVLEKNGELNSFWCLLVNKGNETMIALTKWLLCSHLAFSNYTMISLTCHGPNMKNKIIFYGTVQFALCNSVNSLLILLCVRSLRNKWMILPFLWGSLYLLSFDVIDFCDKSPILLVLQCASETVARFLAFRRPKLRWQRHQVTAQKCSYWS